MGISDTGLDEKSCFFSDLSGQVTRSLPNNPVTDLGRRKVVQYTHLAAADTSDVTNGHGTHVTGTVVGNNRMDVFSGISYTPNTFAIPSQRDCFMPACNDVVCNYV